MISEKVDYRHLRDSALFHNLPESALQTLAAHCHYIELSAGDILFHQGEPGDTLYLLTEGQVHIVRRYDKGNEVVLATEGPYYTVGDLSALVNQPRTGSVVAVSDCTFIRIRRADLMSVCQENAAAATAILQNLGRRLYQMNLLVREAAIGNAGARLASILLLLCGGEPGPIAGDVRVARLARATAVDADIIDRLLQEWVRNGSISYTGRKLTVHHLEHLKAIAG